MSIYQPKRKTSAGVEDVTFPISSVEGLSEKIDGKTLDMPRIRVGAVSDVEGTMIPSVDNPLFFAVEIIDGKLKVGDDVQICTRQLFTYDDGRRRKYRLRCEWHTPITEENVNQRFIFVYINESSDIGGNRFFKTGNVTEKNTLSPVYVRVRRAIFKGDSEVDGEFSNIETVWKKYNRGTGKVFIK